MKKILITQSDYIPWKGYFDNINSVDEFVVYDDMQYTKRDWRNRNLIKTQSGPQWLTIPVEVKGKYFQKINETIIADVNWGDKHWKILQSNYAKAPFFKQFKDAFEPIYYNKNLNFVSEINVSFIKAVNEILDIKTRIIDSRQFDLVEGKTERLVYICKKLNATDYYSGPTAKDYMDVTLFEKESINLHYFDYSNYPVYPQLFGEFTHYVSILDLIFNTGSLAKNYMKTIK
jgi:glutaredoxin-related protein